MEQLTQLNHKQVLELTQLFLSNTETQQLKKSMDSNLMDYPSNALNGIHLYNSVGLFQMHLHDRSTKQTAMQKMKQYVMEKEKVTDYATATSICESL